ncbi:hypothetical protein GE107_20700 [Cohnella sp. CFH 77786]|uniref:hypothetical protein n=1 Tax=Cohnella sp. CFH 77786 TaxID=2662265 RepID=UPI001C60ECC2|nr:hypothetical protein [Cohnella sp. CFH 77786]MBW5448468.1 hypothetical protein [Cohnella sp. CFH 77786]
MSLSAEAPLQEALHELIEVTRNILELDFEEEANFEVLGQLQQQQVRIRAKIEGLWGLADQENQVIRELLQTGYDTELEVNRKLNSLRQEASTQLSKFQGASRMKNAYYQSYTQSEGYFVDRKK